MENTSSIKEAVMEAWSAYRSESDALQSVARLDRMIHDVHPREALGFDSFENPVAPRLRQRFDRKSVALAVDSKQTQRVSPLNFKVGPEGYNQIGQLRDDLCSGDAALLGCDQKDAHLIKEITDKYGRRVDKLWEVGSHCTPWVKAVSKLAADSNGALGQAFLHSELTLMLPDLVEIEKETPSARDFFAMRSLNAPGANSYEFRTMDRKGRAQHTTDFQGKTGFVKIGSRPIRRPLIWLTSGFSLSWLDMQQWAQARSNGSPLPDIVSMSMRTVREALLELENFDLLYGFSEGDQTIHGLFSRTGAASVHGFPILAQADNFADAANSEAAVQLLLKGVKNLFEKRKGKGIVVGLSVRDYLYVATAAYIDATTGATGATILDVAMERGKKLGLLSITFVPEFGYEVEVENHLKSLGYSTALAEKYAGGLDKKSVMVTMTRDIKDSAGIIGADIFGFPPDVTSTLTSWQFAMSTGGFEVRQPRGIEIQILKDPT